MGSWNKAVVFSQSKMSNRKREEHDDITLKEELKNLHWFNTGLIGVERSYLNDVNIKFIWPLFLLFLLGTGAFMINRARVYYNRFCRYDTCTRDYTYCEQYPTRPICQCLPAFIRNETTKECDDRNECLQATFECPSGSACVNRIGGYACHCKRY